MRKRYTLLAAIFLFSCAAQGEIADNVEPTLTDIQAKVFTPGCAFQGCHNGVSRRGDLSLEAGDALIELINVPAFRNAAAAAGKVRVIPNDPDNSFLVQKIEEFLVSGEGLKMPPGSREISPGAIQAVRDWISNGALDD